jgi:hypothetical protein
MPRILVLLRQLVGAGVEILRRYMSGERKNTLPCIPTLALSSIYTEPRTNETRVEHVNVRISRRVKLKQAQRVGSPSSVMVFDNFRQQVVKAKHLGHTRSHFARNNDVLAPVLPFR